MSEEQLDFTPAAAVAGARVRAAEDAELDVVFYSEGSVEREDGGAHGVDAYVARAGRGGGYDARAREEDVQRSFAEGREEAEGQEVVGRPARAFAGELVL